MPIANIIYLCILYLTWINILTVILWNYNYYYYNSNIYFKLNLFLWWQNWIFSSLYLSLQCHMILQKSLYCADLVFKKHFLLISLLKQLHCLIFLWKPWCFFQYSFNRKLKKQHLFEMFPNFVNVVTSVGDVTLKK